uniref:Uncharacterized protein n=1 Tax=Eptatretus burgeri TaxID=7764 RepID=A0A8C4QG82_EPTBU
METVGPLWRPLTGASRKRKKKKSCGPRIRSWASTNSPLTPMIEGRKVDFPPLPEPPNPDGQCPICRWNLKYKYDYTVSLYNLTIGKKNNRFSFSFEFVATVPKSSKDRVPKAKMLLNRYLTRWDPKSVKPIYKRGPRWRRKPLPVGDPLLKDNITYVLKLPFRN